MMIVASPELAEQALRAGDVACPSCSAPLRRYGYARTRTVRTLGDGRLSVRPRRARCTGCGATHVLLPAGLVPRMADATEVIGTALAAKATGSGYRRIARDLGRSASTVRRWLRRVPQAHARWLRDQAVQHCFRLDPDILVRPKPWPTTLGWGLNMLAGAALAYQRVLDSEVPLWTLIGYFTRGHLLSPPLRT